jgi:hypothetical protein
VCVVADEEFRVEVELGSDEHRLSVWDRLRTLGLDDDARERLGSRVTVTRDGNRIFLYTHSLPDAQAAERTVGELATEDHVSANIGVTQWNPETQEWTLIEGAEPGEEKDDDLAVGTPDPAYVMLEAYKPEFLRDLGL